MVTWPRVSCVYAAAMKVDDDQQHYAEFDLPVGRPGEDVADNHLEHQHAGRDADEHGREIAHQDVETSYQQ